MGIWYVYDAVSESMLYTHHQPLISQMNLIFHVQLLPLGEAGRGLLFPFPPLFGGLRELQQFSYFALSAWDDEENGKLFSRKKAFDESCEAQKVC